MNKNEELVNLVTDLVDAVTFDADKFVINGIDCYKTIVPIYYVDAVGSALIEFKRYEDYLKGTTVGFTESQSGGKCYTTTIPDSLFNSAAETREVMHRFAEIRKREMNSILEKLSATVNVMITEAAMIWHKGVSITYADHLSSFFPKPKLEYVFTALAKELTSVGYDVDFNLPCEIIHIRW